MIPECTRVTAIEVIRLQVGEEKGFYVVFSKEKATPRDVYEAT